MAVWVRFADGDEEGFGTLSGETIAVHTGDMFDAPKPTGVEKSLGAVHLLMPCSPSKMICLWNNFHALAAKLGVAEPAEPLYLLKAPSSFMGTGEAIRRPPSYNGKIVYEGELMRARPRRRAPSSATRASMTSPPPTSSRRIRPLRSGRGPKASTRSVSSGRQLRPGSTPRISRCARCSMARNGRTIRSAT